MMVCSKPDPLFLSTLETSAAGLYASNWASWVASRADEYQSSALCLWVILKYRISSNKRSRHFLDFGTARCGVY